MTAIRLAVAALVLVLLLGVGAWYYLYGPNKVAAADLVPSDTVAFATIPNMASIVTDYETSDLKKLVDAPESKPLLDALINKMGPKNFELLQAFLPNMSGQSFLALTHFDTANPAHVGLIGGLKPKPGAGDFNEFVAKWKDAYPDLPAQATSGAAQVEGLDYQWVRGPTASDKICIARTNGWIVFSWGEDSLRDWWERFQKKSGTPSLAQNPDYQKSLKRVGLDSEAIVYLDYKTLMSTLTSRMAKTNPASAKYLSDQIAGMGGFAIGTRFEHGEIADHFSLLMPRQAQLDAGASATPCAFDTVKFTGPDTRFYWGSTMNFTRLWQNFQRQANTTPPGNPGVAGGVKALQNWAQSRNLDIQKNIIGPLGNEVSVQAEWSADNSYPEAGLFIKLDKPDDFKPTIAAAIDTIRRDYATTAVINEINSGDQHFATLKFIQALPISPTITEDGPYFGVFLTENQAVRSFKRDASVGLLNNEDFKRQIGGREKDASQMIFLDSPQFLDRGYQTALPYLSLAAMFNRTLGALIQGRTMPTDLQWLAPIGTWSFVSTRDDDGVNGYSISGIGNQGIFLGGAVAGGVAAFQFLHHPNVPQPAPMPITLPPPLPGAPMTPTSPASPAATDVVVPVAPPVPAPIVPPNPSTPADGTTPALAPTPPSIPPTPPADATAVPAPPASNATPPAPAPTTNQ